jgi:hypothetical protein
MSHGLLSFIAGLLAFTGYIAAYLVILRLRLKIGWLYLQIVVGGVIHIASTLLYAFLLEGFLYWYALGIFAVGWLCFFVLSIAVYVSISANILRKIYKSPKHAMTIKRIYEICGKQPFKERAEFLVGTGQVEQGKAGYQITSTGERNVKIVRMMRRILGLDGSGIYSKDETLKMD